MRATVNFYRSSTSPPAEGLEPVRRRGRVATILAAAALAAPGVAFVAWQVATPSDGGHLRPGAAATAPTGLVVSALRPGASPLRSGDVVVAVGGVATNDLVGSLVGGARNDVAEGVAALRADWRFGARVAYDVVREGAPVRVEVTLGHYPLGAAVVQTWGTILFALVNLLVVAFVFARRADEPAVRVLFVGAGALIGATAWSLGLQVADVVGGVAFWLFQVSTVPVFLTYWASVAHFAAVFPTPLPLTRRRWFVPVLYGASPVVLLGAALVLGSRVDAPLVRLATLVPLTGAQASLFLGLALITLIVQSRRAPGRAGRQQVRWVVLAALVVGAAGLALYLLPPLWGAAALSPNAMGVVATVFPLAVAIAVLHHKLFDIDTLINRTLVYGSLTFAIGAAYVLAVTALGVAFQTRGGVGPALLATGIVAIAFQPLRERLQWAVNRLMYGERDDPAAVLARLGARLEGTLAPDRVLPTLVATVAEALRLPYVAIERHDPKGMRTVATHGHPDRAPERFPLAYRGEAIGDLVVEPRGPDEAFAANEVALLETIARQASVAAYALRATDDLRRSRERLVAAREEERRRLRRELHDGLGPVLASLTLKLDAASNVLDRDVGAARALLQDLRTHVQDAIGDLRTVVHALRPPALDDLGLVGALREQAQRSEHAGLRVSFDAPDALPTVPAAVEVAAFRVVQEALTNVVRHAAARRAWVTLAIADVALMVSVEDDGVGIGRHAVRDGAGGAGGVGLGSMRERAIELGGSFDVVGRFGGGTRLVASFPLDGAAPVAGDVVHTVGRATPAVDDVAPPLARTPDAAPEVAR